MSRCQKLIDNLERMIIQHDSNKMKKRVICYKDGKEYSFKTSAELCRKIGISITSFNAMMNTSRELLPETTNGYTDFDVIYEVKSEV